MTDKGAQATDHRPLESRNGPVAVASALRTLIVDGGYKAGARITERAVGERFGCTAATTREAFHLLEKQGAIMVSARRGARVIDEKLAPPTELFLVWDRLRMLLGDELRRRGFIGADARVAGTETEGVRSGSLASIEAVLAELGERSHNRRLAEAMARVALHVAIIAPGRLGEIEESLTQ